LVFGAWDLHDLKLTDNLLNISQLRALMPVHQTLGLVGDEN